MANIGIKLLSIIIPNYNNGKYLTRCLNSIINYKGEEIQIVVVDDGSKDNSVEVLRKIKDDRLNVICQKNQGASVARNVGIAHATGEYIIFCDSDDYYQKDAIKYIVNYMKRFSIKNDITLFGAYIVKNGIKTEWNKTLSANAININKMLIALYKDGSYNSVWNKIYKRSIIVDNHIKFPVGIKTGEDGIFNTNYLLYANSISSIDKILYCYCYGEGDYTSEKTSDIYKQLEQLKIKQNLRENLLKHIFTKKVFKKQEIHQFQRLQQSYIMLYVYTYTKLMTNSEFNNIRKFIIKDKVLLSAIKLPIFKPVTIKHFIKNVILKIRFRICKSVVKS